MHPMIELLMTPPNFIIAAVTGCIIAGAAIKAVTTVLTTSSQERSRREIAAYIAEGSMTPEHGERLLKADVGEKKA